MKVEVPNTHAILDPDWTRAVVQKHYAQQLELLGELNRAAADLALRCLTSAPDDIPNHLVISVLFRQAIAAADAVTELLRQGAVGQAHLQLRALMEARWGLIYALRDVGKWGRHIYVASIRENRSRARRFVPGTSEYENARYERSLREQYGPAPDAAESPEKVTELVLAMDTVLAKPDNSSANAALEVFVKIKGFEGPWYFDGKEPKEKQVTSIRKLAEAVDAVGEYDSVYSYASDYVHGGRFGVALSMDDMGAYVAPIRTPEGLRQTMLLSFGLLSECCLRVIRQWRPDEEGTFVRTYGERWRGLVRACPDVQVERSRAVNRQ